MKRRTLLLFVSLFMVIVTMSAYTAQFHAGAGLVNGKSSDAISEASDGAGVIMPTPTLAGCEGWEFAGWVASSSPYGPTDELTQEIHRAGELYRLSSISEEFYAVYRYKTDTYHDIYVEDQLVSGEQVTILNTHSRESVHNDHTNNSGPNYFDKYTIAGEYTTWNEGYVTLVGNRPNVIKYVITETDPTLHYWSLYFPYLSKYTDFTNCNGVASANARTNCVISKTGWNTFSFKGVDNSKYLSYGHTYNKKDYFSTKVTSTFNSSTCNFYILRQRTIYTSNPDCAVPTYTVTYYAGLNGTPAKASERESGYHQGVVLPAATPNTLGGACNALWEFAGWTESGSALATDSTGLPKRLWLQGEVYYPERDETLHAVYRRKSTNWEQVEDPNTLQAGEKILIAYNNSGTYYVLSSAESAVGYNASVTKAAGEMNSVDDAALVWTLEGVKGAWRLKDSNGKHLDMTRSYYAYSYTYPWSRWSDEFTISGETNFSIRSNYAYKHYLTADATKFLSQDAANSNIHIYRQVTKYSKTPKCNEVTLLFNSGEGTFDDVVNATVAIEDVTTDEGIRLNDSRIPTPVAPDCRRWKFAGWRVGSGLTATTDAPGVLYKSTDTYIPMQDSITLYAVYQDGDGYIYYEKVNSKSEVTSGGTYMILYSGNNYAVKYSDSNTQWEGTGEWNISNNKISEEDNTFTTAVQWSYNGTYFYNVTDNTSRRLAYNGDTKYAGAVTNNKDPFTLLYTTKTGFIFTTTHYYYLNWGSNIFTYTEDGSNKNFNIYKQKTTATVYNSWPHCTPFELVLNSCGGKFTTVGDTHNPKESNAGDGVVLTSHTPTSECAGWTLVGWVEEEAVQARNSAPTDMIATNATYVPKQDKDQLYAVYSNGSIWSSYPACGEGIEIVEWTPEGVIVESYALTGTPSINGKNGTANGDGTYTLSYDVASNPCVPILIEWGSTHQIFQTPMLVNSYTRISAVTNGVASCATCDMIVLNGGTAIADETKTVRDIKIYPGGRFNLASGKTFTANSLTMRADGDGKMPEAVILGTFNCTSLNHDRRIDNSRYYWIALPYDVTIASINYADDTANGKNAVYDTDYYLKFYDGVQRAKDKGKNDSYWVHIGDIEDESYQTKTTLKAGRGYLIGLPVGKQSATGHTYRTLRFPMTVADWSSESSVTKTVAAAGQDCEWPQHVGWNLIGNPFLQNYSAVSAEDLQGGKLVEYYNDQGVWVEPWYTLEEGTENVPYVTFYNPEDDTYTQTRLIGHNIPPFSTVLVQLQSGKTGLQFVGTAMSSPTSVAARRTGLLNEDENQNSEFEVFAFSSNGNDRFTVILDDNRSKAYEVGADLLKIHNNGQMNVYAHHNGVECVFDAISHADADSIPVGINMPQEGQVCMGLSVNKQLPDDIEHIWLIDEKQKIQTDLLLDTYTFETEAGANNNRLWLRVQKMTDITTAEQSVYGIGNKPYKFIRDGKLTIQMGSQSYDATGTRIR